MEVVNIIGHNNLIRDLESKAILNTDSNAIERYKRQTQIFEEAKIKKDDIAEMRRDIDAIKDLLKRILNDSSSVI